MLLGEVPTNAPSLLSEERTQKSSYGQHSCGSLQGSHQLFWSNLTWTSCSGTPGQGCLVLEICKCAFGPWSPSFLSSGPTTWWLSQLTWGFFFFFFSL
jgi:hypothetical protein